MTHRAEQVRNVVLLGCGAMAIETAAYIGDMDRQTTPEGGRIVVSDVVSTEFSRIGDLEQVLGYRVKPHDTVETVADFGEKRFVVAIGDRDAVLAISQRVRDLGGRFFNVIHPSAYISDTATMGEGLIVAPFCHVAPFATVGDNTILNVRATVGHDAVLEAGCIVSPHVDINGRARIGRSVFIGAGAVVDPGVRIGDFCKVASGVAVAKDLEPGVLAFRDDPKKMKMFDPETGKNRFARR